MDYALTEPYVHLRAQALQLTAAQLGFADPTFGVLVETGYPEAVESLLALSDGTASLYFSNGGGIIGAGQHERPAVAARSLVAFAAHNLEHLENAVDYPLPRPFEVDRTDRGEFWEGRTLTANKWAATVYLIISFGAPTIFALSDHPSKLELFSLVPSQRLLLIGLGVVVTAGTASVVLGRSACIRLLGQ